MTSIRQHLTRKLLLAVGLLIGAGDVAAYLCARAALQAQFDATLRAKAQAITTLTEQKKKGGVKIDNSVEHMRGFDADGFDFFELRLTDGETVERSRSLRDAHLPLRHGTLEAPLFWNLALPGSEPGRAVGMSFRPNSDRATSGIPPSDAILVVASNRRDLDRTLVTLQLVLAGCGACLLAVTALVVPRLLAREIAPLQQLANHAARIDAGSLSARFPTANLPAELAPISARLNELLGRLEESFQREHRFSSDVAHEFRTPIAELRSLAELAIKFPDTRAANVDHEVLSIALHLESVLTHLLTLSRGERGDLQTQRERVTLGPLVEDVCEKFRGRAADRQLAFQWQAPAEVEITSDPILLRSILTNLLDNAVEYSPPGGNVGVELSADGGRFTLHVFNTVENLDEHDLPRLFDRFWRKDTARSNNGHTGLGLSLARTLAQTLGCQLTARFDGPSRLLLSLVEENEPAHPATPDRPPHPA